MPTEIRCELLPAALTRTERERAERIERWADVTARQAQAVPDARQAEQIMDHAYRLHLVADGLRLEERS